MPGDLSSGPSVSLLDLAASLLGLVPLARLLGLGLIALCLQLGPEFSDLGGGLRDLHRK